MCQANVTGFRLTPLRTVWKVPLLLVVDVFLVVVVFEVDGPGEVGVGCCGVVVGVGWIRTRGVAGGDWHRSSGASVLFTAAGSGLRRLSGTALPVSPPKTMSSMHVYTRYRL